MAQPKVENARPASRAFSALLPSPVVKLPPAFGGDYQALEFVYNTQNVMSLGRRRMDILWDQYEVIKDLQRDLETAQHAWSDEWGGFGTADLVEDPAERLTLIRQLLETPPEDDETLRGLLAQIQEAATLVTASATPEARAAYTAAMRATRLAQNALRDQIDANLAGQARTILADVLLAITWPYADPAPQPLDPDSLAILAPAVIDWLIADDGGLKVVRESLRSPLSAASSSTGT